VTLIGAIYKNAKRVVIWLGEIDARVELAMRTIMNISAEVPDAGRREIQEAMRERVRRINGGKIPV